MQHCIGCELQDLWRRILRVSSRHGIPRVWADKTLGVNGCRHSPVVGHVSIAAVDSTQCQQKRLSSSWRNESGSIRIKTYR